MKQQTLRQQQQQQRQRQQRRHRNQGAQMWVELETEQWRVPAETRLDQNVFTPATMALNCFQKIPKFFVVKVTQLGMEQNRVVWVSNQ